jgi:RimJ/RimL family protein N-acetyltransferase
MVTVETARLLLRPFRASDAQPMREIHEDPEVARYLVGGPVSAGVDGLTVAWRNVAMMIGHWHLRGYGAWVVEERATGEVIGRVGLWHPGGVVDIELGWVIRRSRWRRGFATEAADAALRWTWQHVAADRVLSWIQPDNGPSIRVAEKIGQRLEREDVAHGTKMLVYVAERPPSARGDASARTA